MFDRLIRLARAKKALRDGRFEDALQLAGDPLIAVDRRADAVRRAAADHIAGRARQRLTEGDLPAAKADVERLRRCPGSGDFTALAKEIEQATAGAEARQDLAQRDLVQVRRLLEAGETAQAEAMLSALAEAGSSVEGRHLSAMLNERRRQAVEVVEQARVCLDGGALEVASERLRSAETLDRDGAATVDLRVRLRAVVFAGLTGQCRELVRAGDLVGALRRFGKVATQWSVADDDDGLRCLESELVVRAVELLRNGRSLEAARTLARALLEAKVRVADAVSGPLAALASAPVEAADGALNFDALVAATKSLGAAGLVTAAEQLAAAASIREGRLDAVRRRIDDGELEAARALLNEFLLESPLHDAARRELELVDQGLADLDRRLAEARAAVRDGRLRQACSMAVGLRGSGRVAEAAKQLVVDARARMALVDRGLDEVRVALHGRVAATHEGVAHCLKRLEELAKVHGDHEELARVIAAVRIEIGLLTELERVAAAIERRDLGAAQQGLLGVIEARPGLLAADRLDARFCERADELAQLTDAALAAGRLADVEACAVGFAQFEVVRKDFGDRASAWRRACQMRRELASGFVAQAKVCLEARNLAEAEQLVELAQQQWAESSEARVLANDLARVRHQTDVLQRVADLASERDYLSAGQKLAGMPSPSPYLRTRIYDMKQDLARAQGLEGAFLLRVDEGGEHLVLRGDSVTIGNVRQARADVPILAQLAGCHASIRRSMSFHGGMQDSVVAEEGDVFLDGKKQATHVLAAGDRVRLGPAFGFVYQRPCSRSLSAALLLQSGFRVASTDRLLLMKDRGRDGRILLGAGKDVHVRVSRAVGEVELFAANSGQIRVQCEVGGTIDGVPFRGEHPVAAGQVVEANGITFHLMPWRPVA